MIEPNSAGRPHTNDNLRWHELFKIAGVIRYEHINDEMTVEDFMTDVERRLKIKKWVCKCGKVAGLHQCLDGEHEYYCWDCKRKIDFPK